jgi:hypothetical protein
MRTDGTSTMHAVHEKIENDPGIVGDAVVCTAAQCYLPQRPPDAVFGKEFMAVFVKTEMRQC